ncbi:MAG: hypothetical protein LH702_28445 [Phormidesmis sp. CAN_BIN44]|nr:hypothetical protein [Phormidesmis sp. CAN_BIN44]
MYQSLTISPRRWLKLEVDRANTAIVAERRRSLLLPNCLGRSPFHVV